MYCVWTREEKVVDSCRVCMRISDLKKKDNCRKNRNPAKEKALFTSKSSLLLFASHSTSILFHTFYLIYIAYGRIVPTELLGPNNSIPFNSGYKNIHKSEKVGRRRREISFLVSERYTFLLFNFADQPTNQIKKV